MLTNLNCIQINIWFFQAELFLTFWNGNNNWRKYSLIFLGHNFNLSMFYWLLVMFVPACYFFFLNISLHNKNMITIRYFTLIIVIIVNLYVLASKCMWQSLDGQHILLNMLNLTGVHIHGWMYMNNHILSIWLVYSFKMCFWLVMSL